MKFYPHPTPPQRGIISGSTIDWSNATIDCVLTDQDKRALRLKHKSANINLARALDVKRGILEGKTLVGIHMQYRRKQGYGRRMLAADHAALSPMYKK